MSALGKKLLRDVGRLRGQVITIALVVACGIASYVAVIGTYATLEGSRDRYYEQQRFADVFAELTRAPKAFADRIAAIDGVVRVETSVRKAVRLPIPGMIEPARGQVLSIDALRTPALDRVLLVEGRLPEPARDDEAVVLESFATAHKLALGSELPLVLEGVERKPRVVGIAMSPDFVFPIAAGEIVFDPARYGVVWMDASVVERALRMEGAFNHVAIDLAPHASQASVTDVLDRILAPFGGLFSYGRDKHPSHALLTGELAQLQTLAQIIPAIFLGVAAFLVNVVLSRLVQIERAEIASLKAIGYPDRAVGMHYVKLVSVIMLIGAVLGIAIGAYAGHKLVNLYSEFFHFPDLRFQLDAQLCAEAILVSLASAFIGALVSARSVMRLPPAEAMRPPEPLNYHRGLLDRLALSRLLPPSVRMIMRELARRPLRALLSSLGIAMAVAVLVIGRFSNDAIGQLMEVQFHTAQQEDVDVAFVRSMPLRAVRELGHLPGVTRAEAVRVLPVRARAGSVTRNAALQAVPPDAQLRAIVDGDGRRHAPPERGVMLSRKLAELLRVSPGDAVQLESLEGERTLRTIHVVSTVDDLFGLNVYMRLDQQTQLFGEEPRASNAALTVEPQALEGLLKRLADLPQVLGVTRRSVSIQHFEDQNARQMMVMTTILTIFAAIIAAGVVYNNARVSLSMHARELASLRVLGFRRAEISTILLGELAVHTAAALLPGMWLGKKIVQRMMENVDPELYRFPVVISARTYAFAITVTLAAALVSALLVRRRLDHLDLIGVLKTRE